MIQIIFDPRDNCHNTQQNSNIQNSREHVSYSIHFGCCLTMSSTKRQTKNMALHSQHYTVSHETQLDK